MSRLAYSRSRASTGTLERPRLPPEGERDYLDDHPFDLIKHPLPADILVEEVMIPMRDGIRLAANVFRRKGGPPMPVVTTMTPYGKDQYDLWNLFRDAPAGTVPGGGGFYLGHIEISDRTAFEAPDPGFWVPNGYAVVLVDQPGRGKSESNPASTPGPEARWRDVMGWLEQQAWCTGKVAMSGVSALCATQWIAAKAEAPPQLKAIIPWEGINETGPGGGYGGIPETAFSRWLETDMMIPFINPNAAAPEPYIRDWKFDVASITVPALVCASFSDQELHTWDTFGAFTKLKSRYKWLFNHRRQKWGAYYGKEEMALQKRFLDRFLKGDERAMDGVPPVRMEINSNRFKYKVVHATSWPVEETRYRSLYLDATSHSLQLAPPAVRGAAMFAPSPVADPANRAVFDFKFDRDTDLVGHMALKLFIEGEDTDDVDLFLGVEKLDRDGNELYFFSASGGNANGPVARGWLRASWRELDAKRSTEWRPVLSMKARKPLSPGEIVETDIAIMPSGTTFKAGETLRLAIQCWSVRGQWEGGETREWDAIKVGRCRVHTGDRHASRLLIPVVAFEGA
jgi:predicted acyl esterase